MSVFVFILTVYTLCGSSVVLGLDPPSPVRLTSYNMDLVLRWDPPAVEAGDLLYTAQYRLILQQHNTREWMNVCVKTSAHECDLSQFDSSLFVFGTYAGRVRTERGEEKSEWRESNHLSMDKHTIIGPPSIALHSHEGNIEVSITDPEFSIKSLREVYGSPSYNITYWRDGEGEKEGKEKIIKHKMIQQSRLVLDELEPWTKYCVQVQIHTEMNMKPSEVSRIVCESTSNREEAPWVVAVVIFILMALVMTLVGLTVVYRKRISDFFCLKVSLPHSFEHMRVPVTSPVYIAMSDSKTPEEVCHPVSVVTQHVTAVEEHLLQGDQRSVEEEEQPLQAERTVQQEERHERGDYPNVEREHSTQADRTAKEEEEEEECSLKAARSSCSTERDVTEGEEQKEEKEEIP